MAHSTREFTKDKLHKMEASGGVLDRDRDAEGDNYGMTAAGISSSARFKSGGMAHGGAKKSHLGRAHRSTGGRTGPERDMNKASTDITHLPDDVKLPIPERKRGGRAEGGPAYEPREVNGMVPPNRKAKGSPVITLPEEPQADRSRGGRTHNAAHRHHRAHGGRAGKAKTVVNVIVAGGRGQQPQGPAPGPMPPPMPPPMPAAPPPRPPMPMGPPPGMPPGAGPPMGPPPGMPMRARGGKVVEGGAGGGMGRLEKSREEGARY